MLVCYFYIVVVVVTKGQKVDMMTVDVTSSVTDTSTFLLYCFCVVVVTAVGTVVVTFVVV